MKYRMYVDEVGNPDLKSSDNPNHRFLSLTGIIVDLGYVKTVVNPELEALKERFFQSHPDEPVILHRKELLKAKHPFERLRDNKVRTNFDNELLVLLSKWDYTVLTVCIDKKNHKDKYSVWRYDPYHYCMEMLLERYVLYLDRMAMAGDVLSESRGGKEDQRLKKSFNNLVENGTHYMESGVINEVLTSRELKVKPKIMNVSGLQVADIIAHPSRNEILVENGITTVNISPFAQKIVSILQKKYDRMGDIVYGKKFI